MKFWTEPSGFAIGIHFLLCLIPFYWPFGMYAILRYLTNHRPPPNTSGRTGPNWPQR